MVKRSGLQKVVLPLTT